MMLEKERAAELRKSGRIMAICMGALICVGLVMACSIPPYVHREMQNGMSQFLQRLIWLGLGVCGCAAVWRWFDLGAAERRYRWAMWLAILLLLLVFTPGLKMALNGAHRWIHLPFGQGQPSELAKWCLVIFMAGLIRSMGPDILDLRRGFLRACGWIGLVCALLLAEPDFGTAMLIGCVGMAMLLVGGARPRHLAGAAGVGALGLSALIAQSPERLSRVLSFLNPDRYGEEAYQQAQSLIALGSGGVFGKGIGAGGRKLMFLPEANSDFVFAIIGEEMGLIGALAVLLLFGLLIYHGMRIGRLARAPFRSLAAFGVMFAIGLQTLINLAVVTGCAPTKGIALPFISHGGSSLVAMMLGAGLVLSVMRAEAGEAEASWAADVARASRATAAADAARENSGAAERDGCDGDAAEGEPVGAGLGKGWTNA